MIRDDDNTNHYLYGHRTNSAWYWRNKYHDYGDGSWYFLCYDKPTYFLGQMEYMEIKT